MHFRALTTAVFIVTMGLLAGACGEFERGPYAPTSDSATDSTPVTTVTGFADDILPVLERQCAECHGAGSSTALALSDDPEDAYETVLSFVEPGEPEASALLQKASAQASHGGGAVMDVDSEPYLLISNWIASGAPLAATAETMAPGAP